MVSRPLSAPLPIDRSIGQAQFPQTQILAVVVEHVINTWEYARATGEGRIRLRVWTNGLDTGGEGRGA